jgi:glutamate-1-semialdehyde 2,1-aminomutase
MQVGCIIQARLGSTRLPRKVMADIGGWPMIKHVVHRMKSVPGLGEIIVAVPRGDGEIPNSEEVEGDPNDVLGRYFTTAQRHSLEGIMRVTGDCPFIDPFACLEVLELFRSGHYDYVANDIIQTYPDGMGCEMFSYRALRYAQAFVTKPAHRAHVSPWIRENLTSGLRFAHRNVICPIPKIAERKFSVDTAAELHSAVQTDLAKPVDLTTAATIDAHGRASLGQAQAGN